jgi:DNA-binding PadR family transcriptional regulator
MKAPQPEDWLPLTPAVFSVLLALGHEAMHGYAMMQELERRTGGREVLLPGSLYATLARMVVDGLVEEVTAPRGADRRRRYYRLTALGCAVASAEATRMRRLVALAEDQDLLPGTT